MAQLFAAAVNQHAGRSIGVMISVSKADLEYRWECLSAFDQAAPASETDADFVISWMDKSGCRVGSAQETKDGLQQFCSIDIRDFRKTTGSTEPRINNHGELTRSGCAKQE
ncbi:hypothetical protein [Chromobacterium subtsugae]|uniref:hypothetical protein n=1 Tax=Chromobacterium subtsugae TaxID=251747 RepID=UPI0006412B31|nr:hypothetical protein [Chromobacterium subtsugae]